VEGEATGKVVDRDEPMINERAITSIKKKPVYTLQYQDTRFIKVIPIYGWRSTAGQLLFK
jgi:hypothetical protein